MNNFTCVNLETPTTFVLWINYFLHCNWYLFCTLNLNNLFFFTVIENCEEKLALWHIVKYDSIEWLFTDYFCLIIWYSTGSCLSCYYFCNEERGVYKPVFLDFSFSFLRQYWLFSFNENWINLNLQSTYNIGILQFELILQLKFIWQTFWTVQSSIFTILVFSSQIQQFSRFYSQHSNLDLSVNLFLYSYSGFIAASCLNVTECTLGYQYISVTLVLQCYQCYSVIIVTVQRARSC